MVCPTQTVFAPKIAVGNGFTVTTIVLIQPVLSVYVMVTVPPAAPVPVTIPVDDPTEPIAVLLLLHEPPIVASVKVVVKPKHTLVIPDIGAGLGLTVSNVSLKQPVGNV